jgi:hypothetical protein
MSAPQKRLKIATDGWLTSLVRCLMLLPQATYNNRIFKVLYTLDLSYCMNTEGLWQKIVMQICINKQSEKMRNTQKTALHTQLL